MKFNHDKSIDEVDFHHAIAQEFFPEKGSDVFFLTSSPQVLFGKTSETFKDARQKGDLIYDSRWRLKTMTHQALSGTITQLIALK